MSEKHSKPARANDAGSPVVPAATDEPALAVIREAIDDKRAHWSATFGYDRNAVARTVVAALEANGYRIVKET